MTGSNVPALNALLQQFGVQLGQTIAKGRFFVGNHVMQIVGGTEIVKVPKGGIIHYPQLEILKESSDKESNNKNAWELTGKREVGTISIIETFNGFPESGSLVVFTDSDCLSSASNAVLDCFPVFLEAIQVATERSYLNYGLSERLSQDKLSIIKEGERLEEGIHRGPGHTKLVETLEDYLDKLEQPQKSSLNSIQHYGSMVCHNNQTFLEAQSLPYYENFLATQSKQKL